MRYRVAGGALETWEFVVNVIEVIEVIEIVQGGKGQTLVIPRILGCPSTISGRASKGD